MHSHGHSHGHSHDKQSMHPQSLSFTNVTPHHISKTRISNKCYHPSALEHFVLKLGRERREGEVVIYRYSRSNQLRRWFRGKTKRIKSQVTSQSLLQGPCHFTAEDWEGMKSKEPGRWNQEAICWPALGLKGNFESSGLWLMWSEFLTPQTSHHGLVMVVGADGGGGGGRRGRGVETRMRGKGHHRHRSSDYEFSSLWL